MSKLGERLLFMLLGAILTIAALVAAFYFVARTPAAVAYTSAYLAGLHSATTNFHSHTGRWPISLNELVTNSHHTVFYVPPSSGFRDGWERPFVFRPFDTNRGYGTIASFGRDGRAGGVGPDADVELRYP